VTDSPHSETEVVIDLPELATRRPLASFTGAGDRALLYRPGPLLAILRAIARERGPNSIIWDAGSGRGLR
jgi:hypothetical protein